MTTLTNLVKLPFIAVFKIAVSVIVVVLAFGSGIINAIFGSGSAVANATTQILQDVHKELDTLISDLQAAAKGN